MARKRTEIKAIRSERADLSDRRGGRLLNVHPRTLRIYEQEGLVKPTIIGTRRMYSADDIQWITCLRTFIHEEGISIPGLKKLLDYVPCWEVADCPADIHEGARPGSTGPGRANPTRWAMQWPPGRPGKRTGTQRPRPGKKSAAHPPEPVPAGRPAAGRRAAGRAVLRLIGGRAMPPLHGPEARSRCMRQEGADKKASRFSGTPFCVAYRGRWRSAAQSSSLSSARG